VLSQQRQKFYDNGILVVVSPIKTIQISFDKYLTYQFARDNGIAAPKSFIDIELTLQSISKGQMSWPLLVKPRKGSASLGILLCQNEKQLRLAFESSTFPMIQQHIKGDEYGYDVFCDFDFRPISVFCKKKLMMRAGETDKAISTNDKNLIDFGLKVAQNLQIFGPADLDVMVDKDGPKLLEINPRFGGGYPCSHLAGANFPAKLVAIRKGQKLAPDIGSCPTGVCMLKQDEIISFEAGNSAST
jgi:carbamoyl-phosphate synthase large subunit